MQYISTTSINYNARKQAKFATTNKAFIDALILLFGDELKRTKYLIECGEIDMRGFMSNMCHTGITETAQHLTTSIANLNIWEALIESLVQAKTSDEVLAHANIMLCIYGVLDKALQPQLDKYFQSMSWGNSLEKRNVWHETIADLCAKAYGKQLTNNA